MSAITPFRRVLLDLVARFCFDGMEQSKFGTYPATGERFPILVPNDIPELRFRCNGGVPEVFLAACINSVCDTELMLRVWGEKFPSWKTDLRYLTERGLLERYETTFSPAPFGFINPFDGTEILSEIDRNLTVQPPYQIRWRLSNSLEMCLDANFRAPGNLTFYKLTTMGHELREPLEPRGPGTGAKPSHQPTSAASPSDEPDAWLGHSAIAEAYGVDSESLRKRLDRLRRSDHNCYKEVAESERKPREPKYLYRVSAVRPIIVEMEASGGASGERPAKKK